MTALTQSRLMELFIYDSVTGEFTRTMSKRSDRIGKPAGAPNGFGHIQIRIDGVLHMAHRLAFLYVYGSFPTTNVDHIDGNPSNNSICNLRLATPKENQENVKLRVDNTSGHKGVTWNTRDRKWVARVQHHRVRILVGKFDLLDQAVQAVKSTRDMLFTHNKTGYAA